VAVASVRSALVERLAATPGLVVRLRIDPAAPYAAFVGVLDQVKLAGARQLSLETGRAS
jgi:biopolymer transport protein ExbD